MRTPVLIAIVALFGLPAVCLADEIPMVAIGLPFDPVSPEPLVSKHPLFQRLALGEVEALPPTVKSSAFNFFAAAKRSSINLAYRQSFERMNMLAPSPEKARFKLTARWVDSRTPFRIATSNSATVTMHYTLMRLDNAQVLFDREITTAAKGGGVDAGLRDNGIVRAAIASNFASAANCLDDAAYGQAAIDCALTPRFSVSVTRR